MWFFWLAAGLVALFAAVLLAGAPYLPTLRPQIETALDLLDLRPGQHMLELGSGDGKVLLAAAERGLRVTGIELNPLLVLVSWLRTRRYGRQVRVRWGDFWRTSWPADIDGVYTFLLDPFMGRLDERLEQRGVPLVSVAFPVPGRTADRELNGVFYYTYAKRRQTGRSRKALAPKP